MAATTTPRGQSNRTGCLTSAGKTKPRNENLGPPKAGIFEEKKSSPPTQFRTFYQRGDFPISLDNNSKGCKLRWKVEVEKLDLHHYLPLFFDGLRDLEEPFGSIASSGIHDLLDHGGNKVLPVVPQLIIPLKLALETKNKKIICKTLLAIQHLVVSCEGVGVALVPYYRQLLPVMNLFKGVNRNMGDGIDYTQQRKENVADLIEETLEVLERYGGEDAYINIKYMIPTYESYLLN